MIRKDKMPGVCAAMLIGIAAYSSMMSMEVHAEEGLPINEEPSETPTNVIETTSEEDKNYKEYKEEATKDVPENAKVEESNPEYSKDDTGTETLKTETTYTWTDDDGAEHTRVVTTTDTNAPDSSENIEVKPGSSNTNTYGDEEKLYQENEDGSKEYITSETVTVDPTIKTTTNKNESSETHIVETVTTTITTTTYKTVYVYNEDGSIATEVASDEDGNPITVELYNENQEKIVYLQDENGNPAIPVAYYDADGNLLDTSLLNISYVPYTKDDENGNPVRLYYDELTRQVVTEATHKEATSTKEVECGVDEGYTRKEENVTGWHYEDCDASASDAEVKSEKTVYKDEEGAVLVEEGVKCESGDEGAREVTTTTVTGQETTVETVTLYDSDETLKQIKDLLGDFGITVQEIQINEAQTNVNAGLVTSSNSQTGVHGNVIYNPGGTGDNAGYTMIIEKLADGVYFGFKGNVSEVKISSDSYLAQLIFKDNTGSATVDTNYEGSVEELRSQIEALANQLYAKLDNLNAETDLEETSPCSQKYKLDFTTLESDVTDNYNVTSTETGLSSDKTIETNADDQFNVVYTTLSVGLVNKVDLFDQSLQWNWDFHCKILDETGVDTYNMSTQEDLDKYAAYIVENNLGTYKEKYTTTLGTKFTENDKLTICMNSDQIVVVNVDTSSLSEDEASKTEIDLWKFLVNYTKYTPDTDADGNYTYDENGKLNVTKQVYTYNNAHADGERVSQQIIFNFGSFNGIIRSAGQVLGTYIAPNATWVNSTTSNGQLICNKYIDNGGEWHYTGNYTYTKEVPKDIIEITHSYVRDVYKITTYQHKVQDTETKYYKTVTNYEDVSNIPLWEVQATQLKYKTETVSETNDETKTETIIDKIINWESKDVTSKTGGKETVTTTKKTVKPTTDPGKPDPGKPNPGTPTVTVVNVSTPTVTIIDEEQTALAATPETTAMYTLMDEDVPLAAGPKTYDNSFMATLMGLLTAFGAAVAGIFTFSKTRDNK